MSHLEDGTLQAFLDDELPAEERARVAEHLLACQQCQTHHEELTRATALFAQSVSVLDVEPPASRPAGGALRGRGRAGTSSFVKAAGLVLAVAAAASAAVPGSPVREWVGKLGDPAQPAAAPDPTPPSADVPSAPTPAGVSISPAAGRVVVVLTGLEDAVIRLEAAGGAQAGISVVGAERDPAFRTGAGRVEVRNGVGGEVRVSLPVRTDGARLEVDGTLYAESRNGRLVLHVPANTTADGAWVWP